MSRTVILNGEPVELGFEPTSVNDLIKGLYKSGLLKGDVIKSVNLGDKNLLLMEQGLDQPLPSGALKLETVPAGTIILEVLGDARTLLTEIETELLTAVENIRVYGAAGSIEPLRNAADMLLVLAELLSSLNEFVSKWSIPELDLGFSFFKTRLAESLRNLIGFQELKDWSALADLVEYELVPILRDLADKLQESVEKIEHLYNQ